MEIVTRVMGPLTKGSSSESVSPEPFTVLVEVLAPLLGDRENSMTCTPSRTISWVCSGGLVDFFAGVEVGFLLGGRLCTQLHSAPAFHT